MTTKTARTDKHSTSIKREIARNNDVKECTYSRSVFEENSATFAQLELKVEEGRHLGNKICREANEYYKAGNFDKMTDLHWRYIEGIYKPKRAAAERTGFWKTMFAELETIKNEHGHCNVTQRSGKLGKLRSSKMRGELPKVRKDALGNIGSRWKVKIYCAHESCTKKYYSRDLCFRQRGGML